MEYCGGGDLGSRIEDQRSNLGTHFDEVPTHLHMGLAPQQRPEDLNLWHAGVAVAGAALALHDSALPGHEAPPRQAHPSPRHQGTPLKYCLV